MTLFVLAASLMFAFNSPTAAAFTLSAAATGVKTVAWYLHTVIPEENLLPTCCTPNGDLHPKRLQLAYTIARVLMSWGIALIEYIPLTLANRTAVLHDFSLAKLRGAIEAMDLAWLIAFMMMVKGERLGWQHLVGLAVAGVGVAVANIDVDVD